MMQSIGGSIIQVRERGLFAARQPRRQFVQGVFAHRRLL
jgi:hypothetical protein